MHLQITKYVVVGFTNTAISVVVYTAMVLVGVWYVAAVVAAYAAGLVNGYTLHRSWTFRAGTFSTGSFARYVVIQGGGLLMSVGITVFFVELAHVPKVLGQVLSIPFVVAATFAATRAWAFPATSGQWREVATSGDPSAGSAANPRACRTT